MISLFDKINGFSVEEGKNLKWKSTNTMYNDAC